MADLELAAAFGAADAAKEQDLRGYYQKAARVLAEEVRRRKAQHAALIELVRKADELVAHLKKTGRLQPCFNLPALDAARDVIDRQQAGEVGLKPLTDERQSTGDSNG